MKPFLLGCLLGAAATLAYGVYRLYADAEQVPADGRPPEAPMCWDEPAVLYVIPDAYTQAQIRAYYEAERVRLGESNPAFQDLREHLRERGMLP